MALTLQDDMDNIFLNSGFEEDVVYNESGGAARTISAVVFRDGAKGIDLEKRTGINPKFRKYKIEIEISSDRVNGVSNVTPHSDTVGLKEKEGDASNKTFRVAGIIHSDFGNWRIGLK